MSSARNSPYVCATATAAILLGCQWAPTGKSVGLPWETDSRRRGVAAGPRGFVVSPPTTTHQPCCVSRHAERLSRDIVGNPRVMPGVPRIVRPHVEGTATRAGSTDGQGVARGT